MGTWVPIRQIKRALTSAKFKQTQNTC